MVLGPSFKRQPWATDRPPLHMQLLKSQNISPIPYRATSDHYISIAMEAIVPLYLEKSRNDSFPSQKRINTIKDRSCNPLSCSSRSPLPICYDIHKGKLDVLSCSGGDSHPAALCPHVRHSPTTPRAILHIHHTPRSCQATASYALALKGSGFQRIPSALTACAHWWVTCWETSGLWF